jgi:hypothetical protein
MPGQLGPTIRDLFCVLSMSVMRTMSVVVSRLPHKDSVTDVHTMLWDSLSDTGHSKLL